MPRPSWSGHLRLSLVSCPIYLAPATSESERIRLNQINPATGNRISLKSVDSETGKDVDRSQIVKVARKSVPWWGCNRSSTQSTPSL